MSTLHPSVRTHLALAREQLPEGAHVDAAAALQAFCSAAEALAEQLQALQTQYTPERTQAIGPYLNRMASAALDVAREGADAYRLIRPGSPSDL